MATITNAKFTMDVEATSDVFSTLNNAVSSFDGALSTFRTQANELFGDANSWAGQGKEAFMQVIETLNGISAKIEGIMNTGVQMANECIKEYNEKDAAVSGEAKTIEMNQPANNANWQNAQ